ncbi:MAG: HdeA/HdeB family chaperone [Waterburya sp.]
MQKFSWILLLGAIAATNFVQSAWTQTEPEITEPETTEPETTEPTEDIIELQTMTCREVLKSDGEDRANTLIFMHGYISGKQGDATINPPMLADVTDQILDTCINNPEQTLLSVFEASRQ